MEQGTLSVTKTKKGKIIVKVLFEDEKKNKTKDITIQNSGITDMKLNGESVQFERDEGQVVKILKDDKEIFSKQQAKPIKKNHQKPHYGQKQHSNKSSNNSGIAYSQVSGELITKHVNTISDPAKAPYNFVPLNEKVVESELIPDFNVYDSERFTGRIELKIEAKTPLYIRDTMTKEDMDKQAETERNKGEYINSDFFSPAGKLKIPGSSLRGMVRTLVEITSYGRFETFDDKGLYFRGLADKTNLRNEYQKKMSSWDKQKKKTIHKMSAGFLIKQGFGYFIRPSSGFEQIRKDKAKTIIKNYNEFTYHKVKHGWIIISGDIPKKRKDWFIHPSNSNELIPVPEIDIRNYQNDTNRSEVVPDLLQDAGNSKEVPCFYVRWEDTSGKERISFGHTGMFRLAYEKSIGEHIPGNLKTKNHELSSERLKRIKKNNVPDDIIQGLEKLGSNSFSENDFLQNLKNIVGKRDEYLNIILKNTLVTDIPGAIFGNKETFAGRVFFEDADLLAGQKDFMMDESIPKILASPKPTTFQHYLVQTSDHFRNRDNYNDNTSIRGNKLYWHKSGENWIEKDPDKLKNEKILTRITPVKPNTKFAGCIRFENLSKVELGALLFSLDLPTGCYHKLGMGKPLGLGSVQIIPELYLSDRKERYKKLFYEWEHDIVINQNSTDFKREFEKYVLKNAGESGDNLWNTDRIKQLKQMLDFQKGIALEGEDKIKYMEIDKNEFKDRPVLPKPCLI